MSENNGQGEVSAATPNPLSLRDRVQSLRLPDRPMKSGGGFGSLLPWILVLILAGSTGYFAFVAYGEALGFDQAEGGKGKRPQAQGDGTKPLANAGPKIKPGGVALQSKGYIVPISLIQVSPKISGTVMKVSPKFKEKEYVEQGYVLAELEDVEYKADYDRAQAQATQAKHRWQELWKYRQQEVDQAKAELDDTIAQRDQLFREYKRNFDLRGSAAVSPKELEQAESAYKSMEHRRVKLQLALDLLQKGPRDERIAIAKAEMDQWNAELIKAKWKWDSCKVRAPVSGIVLTKKAEEGNIVNPSAFSNGLSASLCEMADLYEMEVDLAIPERDISKVYEGQICQVHAEAFPDRPYQGFVSRIMPKADSGKSAVPTRVKIQIPRDRERQGEYLRPDMTALVTFLHPQDKK